MAKGKGKKSQKKKSSNVYSQFESSQIAEFKEAFEMMDANRHSVLYKIARGDGEIIFGLY